MRKGLSASAIKIVAVITMLIDHMAAVLIYPAIRKYSFSFSKPWTFFQTGDFLCVIYFIMRLIGRLSFPIFCYMIVEGFIHTRSKIKYSSRLLAFGVISEVPFDLAFRNNLLDFDKQNVFFSLFTGLMVIWGLSFIKKLFDKMTINADKLSSVIKWIMLVFSGLAIICLGMLVGTFGRLDYKEEGVLTIAVMYLVYEFTRFHSNRQMANAATIGIGAGCLACFSFEEIIALLNMPLMAAYNGKRGRGYKYFFYIFYPSHLLILYIIKVLIY